MKCRITKPSDPWESSVSGRREISRIREASDVWIAQSVQSQVENAIVFAATDISEINQIGSIVRKLGNKAIAIKPAAIKIGVIPYKRERPLSGKRFTRDIDETARIDFH